jgi:hypothetical protein
LNSKFTNICFSLENQCFLLRSYGYDCW